MAFAPHGLLREMATLGCLCLVLFAPRVDSKVCVETDVNQFLCTDDVALARRSAMQKDDGPARFASTKLDFGMEQRNDGSPDQRRKVSEVLENMELYFQTEVLAKPDYDGLRDQCKNKHELCAFWAFQGECEKNPGYMQKDCAPVCKSCHVLRKR